MFNPREYKPTEDEIVYYYCNADTFLSICSEKKLWLSDIFSMNDFLEMHWGYSIWKKAASELLEEFDKEFIEKIDEIIHESGIRGSLLAACFSLEGDLLSQWRAYANDGKGFVIGFSAKTISQLQIRPLTVLYDETEQIKELKSFIRAIHKVEHSCAEKYGEDFNNTCVGLSFDLIAYKNPAFAEEKEIRIVHLLNFQKSNDLLKLIDIGGNSFGRNVQGEKIKFRMKDGCPVPYIELDFTNGGQTNPIKEVIIGPKNDVRVTAISVFLETNNVEKVKVKKSKASYR
jgi:hypothetical protein